MNRQPPLLDRMAALLDGQRAKQYHGERHLPTCAIGQWIGHWGTNAGGQGAPCSPRCRAIADVLADLERQPALFPESARPPA